MNEFIESRKEIEAILQDSPIGFLGMAVDGKPYVVPLNFAYVEGKILFHCALEGKKLDCLAANPAVCFSVARQQGAIKLHEQRDPCHMDSESVVCYGTARVIANLAERQAALNAFNRYFRPGAPDLPLKRVEECATVEIRVTEMTGRRERDREVTCWRYTVL
jgi:nitroimidazol reductase NimA-like FMN-containing flavoprotein (pyridoxamine 5'-phosphate oxidase superfamily)